MTATDTTTFADATATSTASEEEGKAMKIDYVPVFILAGQSNMVGRCDGRHHHHEDLLATFLSNDQSKETLNIGFWYCNDLNFDADMNAPSCCSKGWQTGKIKDALTLQYSPGLDMHLFGPEMALIPTLVSRLQQQKNQKDLEQDSTAADSSSSLTEPVNSNNKACCCYFIKFAMGSTNLHSNWNPDNIDNDSSITSPSKRAYYPLFVQHVRAALEQLRQELLQRTTAQQRQEPRLAGLFWLQGESDSSSSTKYAKACGANLSRFVAAVRRDFQAPDLPIVASPIVWPRGRSTKNGKNNGEGLVNQALRQAGSHPPNDGDDDGDKDGTSILHYSCIDPLSPELQVTQSADTGAPVGCAEHLAAAALLDIGKRMGEAFPLESLK